MSGETPRPEENDFSKLKMDPYKEHATESQQEASEIRDRRFRVLGKDGFLNITHQDIGHGVTLHTISGKAKGHDIKIECSTFNDNDSRVLEGTVDGQKTDQYIDSPIAKKLWDLYEPITDDIAGASEVKARESLREANGEMVRVEKKKEYASVIDELLDTGE